MQGHDACLAPPFLGDEFFIMVAIKQYTFVFSFHSKATTTDYHGMRFFFQMLFSFSVF